MQVVNALFSYTVPQRPGLQNIAASASKVLHQDSTILSTFIFFRAGRLQGCGGATWQQYRGSVAQEKNEKKLGASLFHRVRMSSSVEILRNMLKQKHIIFFFSRLFPTMYVYTSYTKSIICTVEQFQFSYICQIIRNPNHLVFEGTSSVKLKYSKSHCIISILLYLKRPVFFCSSMVLLTYLCSQPLNSVLQWPPNVAVSSQARR